MFWKKKNTSGAKELLPKGIKKREKGDSYGEGYTYETIYGIEAGSSFVNKFEYEEKFTKLENGVRFNVETLPSPLDKHLKKKPVSRNDIFRSMKHQAASYYETEFRATGRYSSNDIRLESVYSESNNLVYARPDAFMICCVTAFTQHLPLVLSPDHIWTLISYAFAKHVDNNSEALRDKFVKHKGKKRIKITTSNADTFQIASEDQPDTGATPDLWEEEVFTQFSEEIGNIVGDKIKSIVTDEFTTSTPASKACSEISLMASMKNYFSIGMITCGCGIPEVTLLGTEDDWIGLRERAEALGEYLMKDFRKAWLPYLLPVLDNFIESFRGNVHHGFWQSMVKFRACPGGSGMPTGGISGWVQLFYPILENGHENRYLRPWNEMYFTGHVSRDFPSVVNSVGVDWTYVGTVYDIRFHSGFTGFSQDEEGRLCPAIGWYVTHDPVAPVGTKMMLIQNEIEDLLLGNKDEVLAGKYSKEEPWFVRVTELKNQEENLLSSHKEFKHGSDVFDPNERREKRIKTYKL